MIIFKKKSKKSLNKFDIIYRNSVIIFSACVFYWFIISLLAMIFIGTCEGPFVEIKIYSFSDIITEVNKWSNTVNIILFLLLFGLGYRAFNQLCVAEYIEMSNRQFCTLVLLFQVMVLFLNKELIVTRFLSAKLYNIICSFIRYIDSLTIKFIPIILSSLITFCIVLIYVKSKKSKG